MRFWFILLLVLVNGGTIAQSKRYFERLSNAPMNWINEREAERRELDVLEFNDQSYEAILQREINTLRTIKSRKALHSDSTLTRFSQFAIARFPNAFFTKTKYRQRVIKYTDLSLRKLNSSYNLFTVKTFCIELCNKKSTRVFYYDRRNKSTDLRLFQGHKPEIKNPEHPDYVEPVPVEVYSEIDFCDAFIHAIKQQLGTKIVLNKEYTNIGIGMKLDKNTVHTRKVPRAYVYIIFAGKQTQRIKRKTIPINNPSKENPYSILK